MSHSVSSYVFIVETIHNKKPMRSNAQLAAHLSRYVTSHPGQLSLAIPSWLGAMSTSQRAVTPCGKLRLGSKGRYGSYVGGR